MKRLQIKHLRDRVSLAIRKCKTKGEKIKVRELLSPGGFENIVKYNEGYHILRRLRGSPPYWEQAKHEIFAMIRQLGMPTWFMSLSAAETRWPPLLRILGRLLEGRDYTDEEIKKITWQKKCQLIRDDPTSCSRYFDFRSSSFFNHVLKHSENPIGSIKDHFMRVEFQQRGSPHLHVLLWVDKAPKYGVSSEDEIVQFIDQYVTCKKDDSIPDLINYQTHRHARTCRKKGKPVCRFNFPMPPLPKTMILSPHLDVETSQHEKNYQKIVDTLNNMKSGVNIGFSEFLSSLEMNVEEYVLAIRSNLKAPRVFLKRDPCEIRINSYNSVMLKSWEANLDIQYILDPYACAAYIVSYISKGQRGMSNLLYNACKEAKANESDIRNQVRKIGNTFLTNVEVGAQEAAYLVLQMPLKRSPRDFVFVNTNPPDDRIVLLKPLSDLKNMPENSTEVESDNSLKRYARRPYSLQNCCLADFISWYAFQSTPKKLSNTTCNGELLEEAYEENLEDDPVSASYIALV